MQWSWQQTLRLWLGKKKDDSLVVVDYYRNTGLGDVVVLVYSLDASMVIPGDAWAYVDGEVIVITTTKKAVQLWK